MIVGNSFQSPSSQPASLQAQSLQGSQSSSNYYVPTQDNTQNPQANVSSGLQFTGGGLQNSVSLNSLGSTLEIASYDNPEPAGISFGANDALTTDLPDTSLPQPIDEKSKLTDYAIFAALGLAALVALATVVSKFKRDKNTIV